MNKHDRITTDGIDIIIVVTEKNILIVWPIPVKNIWWAQTINDIKPRNITEYTSDLYPHNGLLVLFAIISPTVPKAGKINT